MKITLTPFFSHGPVLSVLAQQIDIDGFAEDQPTLSTSLAFPDQNFDSVIGSVGWQFEYVVDEYVKPYGKLTYNEEFEDAPLEAFARSQSIVGSLPYAVPGVQFDNTYMMLQVGMRTKMFGFDANIGTSVTTAQRNGHDVNFFVSFSKGF